MLAFSFIYIPIIFTIGFIISSSIAKKIQSNIIHLVYLEHMFFSYVFYLFAKNNSADANMYYARGLFGNTGFEYLGTNTDFIIYINSIFIKIGFSKLTMFFLFGLFGFIGINYLIRLLDNSSIKILNIPAILITLLLPGFHFWTSAIGKDSLFFMGLMMFLYSIKYFKNHILLAFFSFVLITLIRPHMGFIIISSIGISFFLKNPVKYKISHLIAGIFIVALIITFIPFIKSFLSIDSLQMRDVTERLDFYSDYGANQTDGLSSYVDVRSYNLPMKMFAYLFRPLFFDAHSTLQLLASFENLFLLMIVIIWLKKIKFKIIKWYRFISDFDKIIFIYLIFGWILLALSMYNLGLASRQKYMLLPVLFILVFKNLNKGNKYRIVKNNIKHLLNK